jgi:hypothetical protein
MKHITSLSVLSCLGWFLLPGILFAQEPDSVSWSFEGEVGASVFFGASDQTTVATNLELGRKGTLFQMEHAVSYLYGEATDVEGVTFVNKRSWSLDSNLDYRGFSRVNPYLFGSALSSLEKKIDLRLKGGAGAKVTALGSEVSRLSLALALLAEQTFKDTEDNGDGELLARWSGELDFRRSFSEDRVVLQAKADYNPVFDAFDNYTVKAATSLAFALSRVVSLKLSVEDNYDSRAKERGARDNNDGRVLFSVLAAFK